MMRMAGLVNSALLGIIEQAGLAVATLVEGQPREDLLRSRLTRAEVLRQLLVMADAAAQVDPAARAAMPELDWDAWEAMGARFRGTTGAALDEALWFACESLVSATLLWLRLYRKSHPGLFRMVP